MEFEKFREEFSPVKTFKQNLDVLVEFLPITSNNYLPRKKAEFVGEKCFDFLDKNKEELHRFPPSKLKPLLSGLTQNSPSNILKIISLLSQKQIRGLFSAPENAIDKSGGYLLGKAFPYAFTGYIVANVAGRKLNCAKLYNGYNVLRKKHGEFESDLVLREVVIGYVLHDVLFSVRATKKVKIHAPSFYTKRWKMIEECFDFNKEHIQKEYGKEINSPILWMEEFLKNHPSSPEDQKFQVEVVRYAEKMKLEKAIPEVEKKRSLIKI